ncbi:MAG: phasin family protein [Nitrospirae bacterium]|nr:phasin family protein [Nitrospirota bacterium]MCL5422678.1 phasin family protein [Nitrospirota bacterium]
MTFFDAVRTALLAGFGVQEKVAEFINDLVKKGELSESQGAKLVKEWTEKADKSTEQISRSLSDIISKTMEKMAIPTKDDIEKLNKKIQTLSARVKKLEGIKAESTRSEEEGPEEE